MSFKPHLYYLLALFTLFSTACSNQQLSHSVDSTIQQFIDSCWLPNAVAYVEKDGKIIHCKAYGYSNIEHQQKCQTNNLFRLASQTKAITVVAFMQLYEKGLVNLNDPVEKYIPQYAGKGITIFHLLTHTSGICYDNLWEKKFDNIQALAHNSGEKISLKENVERMAQLPLAHQPGEKFTYANNTDIIGRLIEIISEENYVEYIQKHILTPLEMTNTFFYLPDSLQTRLVTLYQADTCGIKKVEETENLFAPDSYPSPSAGLCGTIEDYAHFCQMVLNNGSYTTHQQPQKTIQILQPHTLQLIKQNHVGTIRSDTLGFGFAWDVFLDSKQFNKNTVRWGGMYGTDYIIDMQNQLILILYTNCRPNHSGHNHKQAFINAVYQNL